MRIKFRMWISLIVALSFTVLSISGILSFVLPFSRTIAAIHTVFGFLFFAGVIPHVFNNFKSLKSYIRK